MSQNLEDLGFILVQFGLRCIGKEKSYKED